jgi:hypothetical protein
MVRADSRTAGRGLSLLRIMAFILVASPNFLAAEEYETVVDHGPPENRWDLTLLGDGYTESQLNRFTAQVRSFTSHMRQDEVYGRYWNFFNIHRIDVASNESGADIPPDGIFKDTALGASYYGDGVTERALIVDNSAVSAVLNRTYRGIRGINDDALVAVNHSLYGGTGGQYGTFSAGHTSGREVALHEMGHVLHSLADEYGGDGTYNGSEPGEVNVTANPTGSKWARWIGYNQPGIGLIGVYEGGRYFDEGIYRPSENSKMRSLFQPFDAVSREKMVLDIYRAVDPLDDWLDNEEPLVNPEAAWIDLVDPQVLDVEWMLDGVPIASDDEQVFDFSRRALEPGQYTLTARAFDPTDWVRSRRNTLEESVSWIVDIFTPLAGDANYDHVVDLSDFNILKTHFGTGIKWTEGDFNDDLLVNLSDFSLLKTNFGESDGAAVPEPATLVLAWLATAALCPLLRGSSFASRARSATARQGTC